MSNKRHVVRRTPTMIDKGTAATLPNGIQLGMSAVVQDDPMGRTFVGITLGMGTMMMTLSLPVDQTPAFLEGLAEMVTTAVTEHEQKRHGGLVVAPAGIVLPGQS